MKETEPEMVVCSEAKTQLNDRFAPDPVGSATRVGLRKVRHKDDCDSAFGTGRTSLSLKSSSGRRASARSPAIQPRNFAGRILRWNVPGEAPSSPEPRHQRVGRGRLARGFAKGRGKHTLKLDVVKGSQPKELQQFTNLRNPVLVFLEPSPFDQDAQRELPQFVNLPSRRAFASRERALPVLGLTLQPKGCRPAKTSSSCSAVSA